MPRQELVCDADEAVEAAERLGYPVVVKPLDGNHGNAAWRSTCTTAEQVREAYEKAREVLAPACIVETFQRATTTASWWSTARWWRWPSACPGTSSATAAHTIAELVEIVNRDPRRGVGHEKVLTRLEIDDQAERLLAQAGPDARLGAAARARSSTCARPATSRPAAPRSTRPT